MNKEKIREAIKDIIWMARRYADSRQTYAPTLFNDAYDILREEFGDKIDKNHAQSMDGKIYYDISIETSKEHPYAIYGTNKDSQPNQEIKNRKFYKKPTR